VSDDTLRVLERAALERPDDLSAGWAYARELGRKGDRRAHYLEVSRLARAGVEEAWAVLEAWAPRPNRRSRRAPLRAAARLRETVVEGPTAPMGALAARDDCVVIRGERLVAWDLIEVGERLYTRELPGRAHVARCGDDLVLSPGDGTLVSIDARTGVERAACAWTEGFVQALEAEGDRLVVTASAAVNFLPDRSFVLDVGRRFGAVIARTGRPLFGAHVAGSRVFALLLPIEASTFGACDWEGREVWAAPRDGPRVPVPMGGDRELLLTRGERGVQAWEAATGSPRWTFPTQEVLNEWLITGETLVYVGQSDALVALDRGRGQPRWEHRGSQRLEFALAEDVLYVAHRESSRVEIVALDPLTGRPLWTRKLGFRSRSRVSFVHLIPLEHALVVVTGLPGRLIISRLDE
jgi:outer membrane protein assembly factor BamB